MRGGEDLKIRREELRARLRREERLPRAGATRLLLGKRVQAEKLLARARRSLAAARGPQRLHVERLVARILESAAGY